MKDFQSTERPIRKVTGDQALFTADHLAVEEPLEIRLQFGLRENRTTKPIAITMRTPTHGDAPRAIPHDFELALGFLFTEGVVRGPADVERVLFCGPETAPLKIQNVVRVELAPAATFDSARLERHFFTNSSCGICGKTTLDALQTLRPTPITDSFQIPPSLLHALPDFLRDAQPVFDRTGGLHAAALFDLNGKLLVLREDVGRHNALDKLIGSHFHLESSEETEVKNSGISVLPSEKPNYCGKENPFPLKGRLLLVSGRASFELLQKTIMAGIPLIAAVGAPSSLAVDLARQFNVTLVGFLRNNRFNIYSGEERISAGQ